MKKLFIISILMIFMLAIKAQSNMDAFVQELEMNSSGDQISPVEASVTSSTRLFGDKNDLTSVILIIPSGSTVTVFDSDSTYYFVSFEENEGYIYKRHAVIKKASSKPPQSVQPQNQVSEGQSVQGRQASRFSYLEGKYGSTMAARLNAGKIWKGMNSDMVKDSWGKPQKINRVISGNTIQEEWIFNNTWLYFENNTLIDWGAVKR